MNINIVTIIMMMVMTKMVVMMIIKKCFNDNLDKSND